MKFKNYSGDSEKFLWSEISSFDVVKQVLSPFSINRWQKKKREVGRLSLPTRKMKNFQMENRSLQCILLHEVITNTMPTKYRVLCVWSCITTLRLKKNKLNLPSSLREWGVEVGLDRPVPPPCWRGMSLISDHHWSHLARPIRLTENASEQMKHIACSNQLCIHIQTTSHARTPELNHGCDLSLKMHI